MVVPTTRGPRRAPRPDEERHVNDATLLARSLAGTLDPSRLGSGDQIALARLTNAGLVDDELRLADDMRYGLGLE